MITIRLVGRGEKDDLDIPRVFELCRYVIQVCGKSIERDLRFHEGLYPWCGC